MKCPRLPMLALLLVLQTAHAEPANMQLSRAADPLDSELLAAWQATQNGDWARAYTAYQRIQNKGADQRDVLLGLAITAWRNGHPEEASTWYERLLQQHPRDPEGIGGLALLRGALDPSAYEAQLRLMLEEHPNHPTLWRALGHILAHQQRWPAAQAALRNALTLAPSHADHHYNLGVAHDQLRQKAAALRHYRQSLQLTTSPPTSFERSTVSERMRQLEEASP